MDVRKLIDEVERLSALMKGWSAAGPVGAIERDLALEKLRRLYETVLLSEPVSACEGSGAHSGMEREESVPSDDRSCSDGLLQAESSPDAGLAAVGEERTAEKGLATADDAAEATAGVPAGACDEAGEALRAGGATVAAEVFPGGEESVEQKLFDDEPVARHRVDKQVILSLYGDAPAASPYAASAPYRKQEEAAGLPAVPEQDEAPLHAAAPDGGGSKKVLGEVLAGSGATAMNELLGKQTLHADVASKIQQELRGELRQHIGVNDRFMLIRNLFGGDAAAYSAAIERLDGFAELDDALLYIQENFEWDPDSEGVQLLVDLLERKLS